MSLAQVRQIPLLNCALSFFVPGLGQAFKGQYFKGIGILAFTFALSFSIPVLILPLYLWNLYDAFTG